MTDELRPRQVFETLMELGLLDWETLSFGRLCLFIVDEEIPECLREVLQLPREYEDPTVVGLLGGEFAGHDLRENLDRVVRSHVPSMPDTGAPHAGKEKWLLAFLVTIDRLDCSRDDKLRHVDSVYGQFGYPDLMRVCTPYFWPGLDEPPDEIPAPSSDRLEAMGQVIGVLSERYLT